MKPIPLDEDVTPDKEPIEDENNGIIEEGDQDWDDDTVDQY